MAACPLAPDGQRCSLPAGHEPPCDLTVLAGSAGGPNRMWYETRVADLEQLVRDLHGQAQAGGARIAVSDRRLFTLLDEVLAGGPARTERVRG